jgi:hypothetical protein
LEIHTARSRQRGWTVTLPVNYVVNIECILPRCVLDHSAPVHRVCVT